MKNIGGEAFYDCGGLTSITMCGERPDAPNNVFKRCRKLKTIHVPANAKSWAGMSRAGDGVPVAPRNWFEFYEPGAVSRVIAWEAGFWLDLAMGSRHLKAIRRYMKLNPARLLWKQRHPDRFKVWFFVAMQVAAFTPAMGCGIII